MTVSDSLTTDGHTALAPRIDLRHSEVFDYKGWVKLVEMEADGEVVVVYESQTF